MIKEDRLIVLNVLKQVEEELSLAVQIENRIPQPICTLIDYYTKQELPRVKVITLKYFKQQKPSETFNRKHYYGRFNSKTAFWWTRHDYYVSEDGSIKRVEGSDDYILECNKQRLDFIRLLILKLEL